MIIDLEDERSFVMSLPDSPKKDELLERIDEALNQLNCGPDCSFCGDAGFTGRGGNDDVQQVEDPLISSIANQFQIITPMNKKVVAGILIVSAVVMVVIGIKMWRKAVPAKAE